MNNEMLQVQTGNFKTIETQINDLIYHDEELKQVLLNDTETVKKLFQSVIIDELKQDIRQQKLLMSYDYETEKLNFLGHYESEHTKKGYLYSLADLEQFCRNKKLKTPLLCTAANIDDWIYHQRKENKAAATICRNISGVSAFFSYIERTSEHRIINPVRGTKARPRSERKTQNKFYSMGNVDLMHLQKVRNDIYTIIDYLQDDELKAILVLMVNRGLRCGSFENMTIHGDRFKTLSKGKTITGKLSEECLKAVTVAGIKHNEPFKNWTSNRIKCKFRYYSVKLYKSGQINFIYSCHDLRHYYALNEYLQNRDIFKLSKLLNHSNIAITEHYLRGFKIE